MLTNEEIIQFKENGFVIKDILEPKIIHSYLERIRSDKNSDLLDNNAMNKMMNIQFLNPNTCIKSIQDVICNKSILAVCSDLFGGGRIILDGASLFYAKIGVDYRQGWHRDIMQVPDEDIKENWFSKDYIHNNIQVNIPLLADSCFWLVKGSHNRPFNLIEEKIFKGSLKMAPIEEQDKPIGDQIILNPGQAVFYNNLAIHRGYGGILQHDRSTIQLGYHTTLYKPTFHFAVLNPTDYSTEYLDSLDDEVRNMMISHLEERKKFEDLNNYYQRHQQFIDKEFKIK